MTERDSGNKYRFVTPSRGSGGSVPRLWLQSEVIRPTMAVVDGELKCILGHKEHIDIKHTQEMLKQQDMETSREEMRKWNRAHGLDEDCDDLALIMKAAREERESKKD